jgi:hypothetical protein
MNMTPQCVSIWRRDAGLLVATSVSVVAVSASMVAGLATGSRDQAATSLMATQPTAAAASHPVLTSDTLVSGASEHGSLVIVNNTGRAIPWNCPYVEVQLTNARWGLEVHPILCPEPAKTLQLGTTRLAFSLGSAAGLIARSQPCDQRGCR